MSKTKTLIAGALAAAIAGTALAPVAMAAPQGRGGPQADAQVFANFDADKDGKITSDEANARPMMGQRNAQNKRGPQDGSGYDNKQRGGRG